MKVVRVTVSATWQSEMMTPKTHEKPDLEEGDLDPNVDDLEKVKHKMRGKLRTYIWPTAPKGHEMYKGLTSNLTRDSLNIK